MTITIGQVTLELDSERYKVKESPYHRALNQEIEAWLWDGCWDVYAGYDGETYYQELVAFQKAAERLFSRASDLGCRGNLLLASRVEGMETELDFLRSELIALAKKIKWE